MIFIKTENWIKLNWGKTCGMNKRFPIQSVGFRLKRTWNHVQYRMIFFYLTLFVRNRSRKVIVWGRQGRIGSPTTVGNTPTCQGSDRFLLSSSRGVFRVLFKLRVDIRVLRITSSPWYFSSIPKLEVFLIVIDYKSSTQWWMHVLM